MNQQNAVEEKLLRLPAVIERVGFGRSWIYTEMKAGRFPKPVAVGTHRVAWRASEVQAWIGTLPREVSR